MARLAGYDGSTFKAKTGSSSLLLHEGIRRLTILPNPLPTGHPAHKAQGNRQASTRRDVDIQKRLSLKRFGRFCLRPVRLGRIGAADQVQLLQTGSVWINTSV